MKTCDKCKREYELNKGDMLNVVTVFNCNLKNREYRTTGDYTLCDECMRCLLAFLNSEVK